MGFKDLASFNVAMLEKQGWRFQTDVDSLVTRLFKAWYFPNCDFLGSRLGSNLKYVWKSIFSAKMVLKRGARWRIGTGDNMPLFDAPWFKDGLSFAVDNPMFICFFMYQSQICVKLFSYIY